MSAPLKLTPTQLGQLASALNRLTKITEETGVDFTSYGQLSATIGDSNLRISHDGQRYIVDEYSGC